MKKCRNKSKERLAVGNNDQLTSLWQRWIVSCLQDRVMQLCRFFRYSRRRKANFDFTGRKCQQTWTSSASLASIFISIAAQLLCRRRSPQLWPAPFNQPFPFEIFNWFKFYYDFINLDSFPYHALVKHLKLLEFLQSCDLIESKLKRCQIWLSCWNSWFSFYLSLGFHLIWLFIDFHHFPYHALVKHFKFVDFLKSFDLMKKCTSSPIGLDFINSSFP